MMPNAQASQPSGINPSSGLDPQLQAQLQAQMADIIEPAAIAPWPPAWGWWVLAAVALLGVTLGVFFCVKHHRANRYRRQALAALKEQSRTMQTAQQQAQSLMQLSKQVALHAYPNYRQAIAQAHGQAWLNWLNATTTTPLFTHDAARQWQLALYTPPGAQAANTALPALFKRWIKQHLSAAKLAKKAQPTPEVNHV